mgnify:CR=1 FL=1
MSTPIDVVLERFPDAKGSDKTWTARCPAHEDRTPSLSISEGDDGRVLIHCHTGCSLDAVLAAVKLETRDLFPPRETTNERPTVTDRYPYVDETGELLYYALRWTPKGFSQTPANGRRGPGCMEGVRRVLFRLPAVLTAVHAGDLVYIVEGEKDAERLTREGVCATTSSQGAKNWHKVAGHARQVLAGADVIVVQDRDKEGRAYAHSIVESLAGSARTVLVVEGIAGKDVSDHLNAGHTIADLIEPATEPGREPEPEPEPEPTPDEPWPEPIPLGETERVAEFPSDALPTWMQPIVSAIATDLQAEPDLPAILGLIAMSVASAGSRHVLVRGTWREPLNIYCAVALPPSSGKSPAFKHMLAPIRGYEKVEMERSAGQVEHVAQTRRMIEKAMKRAEDKGDAQEARIQLDKLMNTPEAHPFRLMLDDATPEALVQKLYEHNERLAILSTEGGPFEMMGGRYSDNANLDPYLKPWSNDPIQVDRIGRPSTMLDHPVLTIGLTVQPTVIARLAHNPAMIGRGLTARFMYSVPPTNTGHRDMLAEGDVPEAVRTPYGTHITAMLAESLKEGHGDITINRDAALEFHLWRQTLEDQRGPGGYLNPVSEWTTKLESTVLRVAGLLALGDLVEVIDVATMRRSIAIGNYWLSHIRAVLDLWGQDDTVTKARQVIAWAGQRELSEFTVRELYMAMRRLFPTAEDTRPVLSLLTERGWIRPLFDGPLVLGRRGVDSPGFAVRPLSSHVRNNHASHASHAPKHGLEQNLLTSCESEGSTPPVHETHGTHDNSEPPEAAVEVDGCPATQSGQPCYCLLYTSPSPRD